MTRRDQLRIHRTSVAELAFEKRTISEQYKAINKPCGLWYGFGGSWIEWVVGNQPDWIDRYRNKFIIDVKPEKILRLKHGDMLPFTKEYGCSIEEAMGWSSLPPFSEALPVLESLRHMYINWNKVMDDYHGIEIPEYHYDFRLHPKTFWYYGWDCASGCIWDEGAIEKIRKCPVYKTVKWIYTRNQLYGKNRDKVKRIQVTARRASGLVV